MCGVRVPMKLFTRQLRTVTKLNDGCGVVVMCSPDGFLATVLLW